MENKKLNTYINGAIILLSMAFVFIFTIAVYFRVEELYPIIGPFTGALCYWLIRLYQYVNKKQIVDNKIIVI